MPVVLLVNKFYNLGQRMNVESAIAEGTTAVGLMNYSSERLDESGGVIEGG